MPNRLRDEPSPYLRQHADNPVDWYPWGKTPFDQALAQDKPILLSIGYSACHWCHVMAHESFEDPDTAALMNRLFINIKVDREEHPDVDQLYQHALQVVSEQGGGWPLTMFLLPTGEPFFGGTYFPPTDRHGRPSFRRVLDALSQAYKDQHDEVRKQGHAVVDALSRSESRAQASDPGAPLVKDFAERAALRLAQRMDSRHGGFQGAPKFPNPSSLELQLRGACRAAGDTAAELRAKVLLTLRKMADGGIHDQLGGGFARYSTDEVWLVPHFEKMLYDNGQLLRLYAEAAQVSPADGARFGQVARGILQWLEREMRDAAAGLYAAQDADSEGVEGKYFVWSPPDVAAELARALGPQRGAQAAAVLCRCYDVRPGGNWRDPHGHGPEGQSILHIVDAPRDEAEAALLAAGRAALLAARLKRVPPGTDDKVLSGWNGLAVTGLAEAGRIFAAPEFILAARRTADFVLEHMWSPEAGLRRTYKHGVARLPGTIDDHAFVAEGLIYLSGATGEGRYLEAARRIMNAALHRLYDGAGGFYMAPEAAEGEVALPMRPRSLHDSAIPAGMSVACSNLLRLRALLPPDAIEVRRYQQVVEQVLSRVQEPALRNPFGLSSACAAIDLLQHGLTETIIVAPTVGAAEGLLAVTRQVYVPDHFVFLHVAQAQVAAEWAHLLEGKALQGGRATAYVCSGERCSAPVTEPAALRELLYNR